MTKVVSVSILNMQKQTQDLKDQQDHNSNIV